MCAIVGFVGPARSDASAVLRAMADTVAHRGPDADGFHLASFAHGELQVGLGHRRLAIIDLVGGDQPIGNETGSLQIVFNGEIYNHRGLRAELQARGHCFATASDTETIVHAYEEYGARCVDHLRGMFAFAIWDARAQRLFLARDRFGEKPLYYAEIDGHLVFASEMKAFHAWPDFKAQLNAEVLPHYLQYRYVPGPQTWARGVHKLSPGCHLTWEHAELREERYYRPRDGAVRNAKATKVLSDSEAAEAFRAKLTESVALMMSSDVPYGAFLSGGLDSSAIVALMARHSGTAVRTFSVGFSEQGFNELGFAAMVAERFGTQHTELMVRDQEVIDWLPQIATMRDAPVAEPADVPMYLLAREARKSVKMVLTGEGSDEVLGGYPKHVYERLASPYLALPRSLRRGVVEPLVHALPYSARRIKVAVEALGVEGFEERMPRWFGALSSDEVEALCGRAPTRLVNGASYPFESASDASALRRILFFDQTSWLPDNLLERGDRMTMAASIEARMPFMDHQLIEFSSSLPDHQRVRGTATKRVLREAVSAVLPAEVLARRKVGFRMPIHLWLRTTMRDMLTECLLGSASVTRTLLNRETVERYVHEHLEGRQNHEKLLWMLLNFELWVRQSKLSV
ncbi:MAG: asparagine synthase (glutamine-hydrolyzing) [Rhizobacter sp.]